MRTTVTRPAIALAAALLVAGCGADEDDDATPLDEVAEGTAGDEDDTTADESDGETDDAGETDDDAAGGDVASAEIPDGFPDDIPVPDAATITGARDSNGGATTWGLDMTLDADVDDVTSSYVEALESNDWEDVVTRDEPNGTYTSAQKGDEGRETSFKVVEAEDGSTRASITASDG